MRTNIGAVLCIVENISLNSRIEEPELRVFFNHYALVDQIEIVCQSPVVKALVKFRNEQCVDNLVSYF